MSLLDPDCFTVTLQWAMGSSPHNKTTAVPSVHTHRVHICCFRRTLPPTFPRVASSIEHAHLSHMHLVNRYYTHKVIDEKRKTHRDNSMLVFFANTAVAPKTNNCHIFKCLKLQWWYNSYMFVWKNKMLLFDVTCLRKLILTCNPRELFI